MAGVCEFRLACRVQGFRVWGLGFGGAKLRVHDP